MLEAASSLVSAERSILAGDDDDEDEVDEASLSLSLLPVLSSSSFSRECFIFIAADAADGGDGVVMIALPAFTLAVPSPGKLKLAAVEWNEDGIAFFVAALFFFRGVR